MGAVSIFFLECKLLTIKNLSVKCHAMAAEDWEASHKYARVLYLSQTSLGRRWLKIIPDDKVLKTGHTVFH